MFDDERRDMQDEATMSFRLSPQQELEWSTQPDGPIGGAQVMLELTGPVDVARLREALGRAIERHEILRTTFRRPTGMKMPLQVVRDAVSPEWKDEDLRGVDDAKQQSRLAEIAAAAQARRWNYEEGPLVSACLASLADNRRMFVLTAAPPCADAGSIALVAGEIAAHYAGREITESPLQYADFAEWQNELLSGEDEDAVAGRQFWSDSAAGPPTRLPFMRPAPVAGNEAVDVPVTAETLAAIESAAARYGVASSSVVLAAWHVTVAKLAAEDEVTLGFVSSGRIHRGARDGGRCVRASPSSPLTPCPRRDVRRAGGRSPPRCRACRALAGHRTARVRAPGVGFVAVAPRSFVAAGDVTFACLAVSAPWPSRSRSSGTE